MNNTDWIRLNDISDYKIISERPKKYYIIICKGGALRAAFPDIEKDKKGNIISVTWECGTGAAGLMYDWQVIACKEIDIPDDIIKQVLSNKRALKSYFGKLYS